MQSSSDAIPRGYGGSPVPFQQQECTSSRQSSDGLFFLKPPFQEVPMKGVDRWLCPSGALSVLQVLFCRTPESSDRSPRSPDHNYSAPDQGFPYPVSHRSILLTDHAAGYRAAAADKHSLHHPSRMRISPSCLRSIWKNAHRITRLRSGEPRPR